MAEPTEADLKRHIERLVHKVDLDDTSTKKFTALLSEELGGIDLSRKKKFIKATLTDAINSMDGSEEESEEEEEEVDDTPKNGKQKGGLAARKEISDSLASFLRKGKLMARTEIVKELWAYIRENNLQNPNDKREILLDDAMREVFGCDSFTMFSMNKYVSAHVYPFKPVDLTSSSSPSPKKRKRKAATKNNKPRKKGTQAPYQLSPELTRVVEKRILPRPQVTQALWVYIRKHNLQNPNDKREIICDDKLRAVMGGKKKVTMFSMNKYITPHLLEKLDKSYYTHEEEDDKEEESQEQGSNSEGEESGEYEM